MFYIYAVVFVLISLKLYQKFTCGMCKCKVTMTNKVVIVTGANTGIGFETAKDLARRGAKVILACRNTEKGKAARDKIIESTGNKNVIFKQLDLTSLKSVRTFASDILKDETTIHVLINNAGTGVLDNSLTEDNLPIESQVNHFAPFLLTVLLLPLLKSSSPSRIVNVSSVLHWLGKVDLDSFHQAAKNFLQHRRVYSNTKLANILFANKLSRDLKGTGVTVNSLHPGGVSTDIFRDKNVVFRFLARFFLKTPYEGAQTTIHLAVAPELAYVSGNYYSDCVEARMSGSAQRVDLAEKLWRLSESAVKTRD